MGAVEEVGVGPGPEKEDEDMDTDGTSEGIPEVVPPAPVDGPGVDDEDEAIDDGGGTATGADEGGGTFGPTGPLVGGLDACLLGG